MLNHAGWLLLPVIAFKSCNFKCPLIKQGVASGTKNVSPREKQEQLSKSSWESNQIFVYV